MNVRLQCTPIPHLLAGAFILTCCSFAGASSAAGQGLDDLFTRPGDVRFTFPEDEAQEETGSDAFRDDAEEPAGFQPATISPRPANRSEARRPNNDAPVRSSSDLRLVDGDGSASSQQAPTAMQLRQARAMAESRARFARLEAARWGLRPTLRPSWTSDPMTSSQFPSGPTYIVPVYVWTR